MMAVSPPFCLAAQLRHAPVAAERRVKRERIE